MAGRDAAIPAFRLYGEAEREEDGIFAHIETIAERSSLHDWEIAPHRHHRAIQVLIVAQGSVMLTLDGTTQALDGPCHVTVPAGAVHGFRFAPATHGWVLTLGQAFAARSAGPGDPLGRLLSAGGAGVLAADAARRIALLAGELLRLAEGLYEPALFHALAEALVRSLPAGEAGAAPDDRRLALFRHLVETHLAEHRPVQFYAASLGMTVRTLNRICQARLGCTPLEAINRRVAGEARRLLRYTNATVSQVADELGFGDPSYFSRFYLRMTGRRPAAERD